MLLSEGAWVVVADGEKFLLLENRGKAGEVKLSVCETAEIDVKSTHEQGTDRPGRYPSPGSRRSAVAQTDWKALTKEAFAKDLAHHIKDAEGTANDHGLVLIADPRTLGNLRKFMSPRLHDLVIGEIAADFTHHPVEDVENAIRAA